MPHETPLIATIVAGLCLAFVFGAVANRFKAPPLVGYLLAGILVGPFTPGYVADQKLAPELAEIGVILLMFGVGLHFSLKDLLSVRKIAVPGAVVQMAAATVMGMGLGWLLGWPPGAGLVFGLALSVASTVVLLKALQERRLVETQQGKIAVGWLIVEDLAMVLALVLLPALSGLLGGKGPNGEAAAGMSGEMSPTARLSWVNRSAPPSRFCRIRKLHWSPMRSSTSRIGQGDGAGGRVVGMTVLRRDRTAAGYPGVTW